MERNEIQALVRDFGAIGAQVKVREAIDNNVRRWDAININPRTRSPWRRLNPRPTANAEPRIDIRHAKGGAEVFDIAVPSGGEARVLHSAKTERHLLLLLKNGDDKARFLCGHDERHWFVASIPDQDNVHTVAEAKVALQPAEVRRAARKLRPKERSQRHNAAFIRQGEWFFLPYPEFQPDATTTVLRNEPLTRGRGRPHLAEYVVHYGGEPVWVAQGYNGGVDLRTRDIIEAERASNGQRPLLWRSMTRDAEVYAKGTVRHPDHSTVDLGDVWHKVLMNREREARSGNWMIFLD